MISISFNANGGIPNSTLTRLPGTRIISLPENPVRGGNTFVGWFTTSAATGGTRITANTVVPNHNTIYWARWTTSTFHPWYLPGRSTSFRWGNRISQPGSVIRNAWEDATNDWWSASRANFFYSPNSVNVLNSWFESSSTFFGRATVTWNSSTGRVISFVADINAGNTTITSPNVARSVANHEFGHVLGLDDLFSGTSIMNVNRQRGTTFIPQATDINGIIVIYD